MQNMPDYAMIMQLARSPEGQKLIAMLQHSDSAALSTAMKSAQQGDYAGAKNALAEVLNSPKIQQLIRQLEG